MAPRYIMEEARYYLKKVISLSPGWSLSIDEFLDILKEFKKSKMQHNKDVFSCIIRELLIKWSFFLGHPCQLRKKYANVFGGIIEHGLITDPVVLNEALQFVLFALKKEPNTKMFDFGITALNRFYKRFGDRAYFDRISAIPHLKCFPRNLIEWVEDCKYYEPARVNKDSRNKSANFKLQSTSLCSPKTAPVVDTRPVELEEFDFEVIDRCPNDREKITFIINNLSAENLREKCAEIRAILRDENVRWLSEYLVESRVCAELNLHALYSDLLDGIANENLNFHVMSITVENIRALLDGDTMDKRNLLKTLGHWLGVITLAKNKPLPFTTGYLNTLLMKACTETERMMYIVPFIAKILMSCAKSKVFGPKSSWTQSVLKTLVELHNLPGLKLNLQFEIEILCKSFNIGLEDFKSGKYQQISTSR